MNNYLKVKVLTANSNKTIKLLKKFNVNIYNIEYEKNYIIIKINLKDYNKIKKLLHVTIINEYGPVSFCKKLINNVTKIIMIFSILLLVYLFSNIIVKIEVITENTEIRKLIENELYNNKIRKFTIKKSSNKIEQIENKIINDHKDKIEWMNIERVGMNYIVNVEPKIIAKSKKKSSICNIVALKEGTISRIISQKGQEMKEVNENVKKGDVIISGIIKKDEEEVEKICAEGTVFAKTWYTINITTPNSYEVKKEKDKSRFNILIKYNNKSFQLFKDRLSKHIDKNKRILNIFGLEIYLQKQIQVTTKMKKYDEKSLQNRINKLVNDKMKAVLKKENGIISQKVLKKEEKDSKIYIEMFIVAEEEIGKKVNVTE